MAKEKAKSRRRKRYYVDNTAIEDEEISRRERNWQKAHAIDQKKSSWQTVYFSQEGKYVGHINSQGMRHGEGLLLGDKGMWYEGEWENGLLSGTGIKQFPSGDRYEGNHVAGKRKGWGYYLFNCGDKYTGQWVDNLMHGQGCFVWAGGDMYSGSWKKGVISGKGHKAYADGSSVKGWFRDGVPNGWCVKTLADGDMYTGCLVAGRRQGFGQYKWFGGDVYTGMWVDDCMQGEGELIIGRPCKRSSALKDNEVIKYRGEFEAASRHGYGEGTYASGVRYLGHWRNDEPHGWGTMIYPNGDIGEGEFKHGVLMGTGLMVFCSHDHTLPPVHGGDPPIPPTAAVTAAVTTAVLSESPSSVSSYFLLSCLSAITPVPLLEQLSQTSPCPYPSPPPQQLLAPFQNLLLSPSQPAQLLQPLPPSQVPLRDDLYRGEWHKGYPHGKGAMDYSSGNIFLGQFSSGVREGEGILLRKRNKSAREQFAEVTDEDFGGLIVAGEMGHGGLHRGLHSNIAVVLSHGAFSLRDASGNVGGESNDRDNGNIDHADMQQQYSPSQSGGIENSSLSMAKQNAEYFTMIEKSLQWGGVFASTQTSKKCTEIEAPPSPDFPFDIIQGVWEGDRLKKVL